MGGAAQDLRSDWFARRRPASLPSDISRPVAAGSPAKHPPMLARDAGVKHLATKSRERLQ